MVNSTRVAILAALTGAVTACTPSNVPLERIAPSMCGWLPIGYVHDDCDESRITREDPDEPTDPDEPCQPGCNSGRGNGSEGDPDGDPGNSGGRNNGGD